MVASRIAPSATSRPVATSRQKWLWSGRTPWSRRFIEWRLYVRYPVLLPGFVRKNAPQKIRQMPHSISRVELNNLGQSGNRQPTAASSETQASLNTGPTLPQWDECKACGVRPRQLAPTSNSGSWDPALTPDGPRMLEANLHWCTRVLQVGHRIPPLRSLFMDYYEEPEHLPGEHNRNRS
jgi:hypothetical protein